MVQASTSASQIVVLLFTDIVDSTALYDRLGDDAAESVRRAHFRTLREAILESGGREVKSLGDGLMVVFQSAVEAVHCAVRIQEHMSHAEAVASVEARVGLHVGEPIREEDDYFGTAVITARRLCDRAEPGEILASDVVVGLLRGRAGARFEAAGPLQLKGLRDPVVAYRVIADAPVGSARVPELPAPLASRLATPLAGRNEALDTLKSAWKQAAHGERRVVLIGGEPGIGKTRLAAELARAACEEGAAVLFGRCDADAIRSYQPFAEALRHLLGPMTAAERQAAGLSTGPLASLLPDLADAETVPRETDRSELFDAVVRVIGHVTRDAPAVLVLDDLHWADEPTLLLLRYLLRDSEQWPLLVVGTYRDTELGRTHPLSAALAELRRDATAERVRLGGLEEADVVELLAPGAADPPPATVELAKALLRETEGNPFFVHEMVRHLLETGRVTDEDGALVPRGPIERLELPEGIREVVGQRLSRLSAEANERLAVAAVLGLEFDVAALTKVSGASVAEVLESLDEAVSARIVEEAAGAADRYGFGHALIRSTLYDELTSARRLRLHWRAAEVFDELGATPSEIASHAIEGAPVGDMERAGTWIGAAIEEAIERAAAYEEAIQLCDRGMQLVTAAGPTAARVDLLVSKGEAMLRLGQFEGGLAVVLDACAEAEHLGDTSRLAHAAVIAARSALGSTSELAGPVEEWTQKALALLPPGETPERARLLGVLTRLGGLDDTLAVLELARRVGDMEALVYASLSYANRLRAEPRGRERFDVLEEARVAVGNPASLPALICELNQIDALFELGDRDAAAKLCEHTDAAIDALRLPWQDEILLPRAGRAFLDGRFDEAVEIATEVMTTATLDFVQGYAGAVLLASMREQDRGHTLIPFIEQRSAEAVAHSAAATATSSQDSRGREWAAVLGFLEAEAGLHDEARRHLEGVVEDMRGYEFQGLGLFVVGDAAVELGDEQLADLVHDALEPWSGSCIPVGNYFTLGAADRVLGRLAGLLGRGDEARARFAAALGTNRRLRSPHLVAQVQLDLAELLEREGDPTGSAALRAEVAAVAAEHGFARLARLAAAEAP